jgi:hypothetical protein
MDQTIEKGRSEFTRTNGFSGYVWLCLVREVQFCLIRIQQHLKSRARFKV